MKTRLLLAPAVLSSVLVVWPLRSAVETAAQPGPPAATMSAEFVDADAPEFAEIRQLGSRAIERLGYSLVVEASSNVAKVGAEAALAVCHLKDVPATGKVIADMPRIVALKRTSLRLRDPANAPDEADQLALRRVRREIEQGTQPPRLLLQSVEFPGGRKEMRAYRPVGVTAHCLPCHGPAEAMSGELRTALKSRYPEDAAIDFKLGEWRGLIRVSIGEAPPPPPPAKSPAAKSPAKKA